MTGKLEVDIVGLKLRNPTILPAGFLGVSGKMMKRVAESGAGAVTTKSIGLEARTGHPNPTVLEWNFGVINAVGLSNPGYKNFGDEIKIAKESGVPVIASIFADNPENFVKIAIGVEEYEPDAIELNISCPNLKKGENFGQIIGKNPELSYDVVNSVKKNVKLPIITKLTPNVNDIKIIAKSVEKAGTDVISAINTLGPGMIIDVETGNPIMGNKSGGLSGPAVRPIAVRCVYDIYEVVKVPVIGVGGITSGRDAIEMMMVGASAVGIGSAIYYRGIDVFKKICDEMIEFLNSHNYSNIKEIVGIAHRD